MAEQGDPASGDAMAGTPQQAAAVCEPDLEPAAPSALSLDPAQQPAEVAADAGIEFGMLGHRDDDTTRMDDRSASHSNIGASAERPAAEADGPASDPAVASADRHDSILSWLHTG